MGSDHASALIRRPRGGWGPERRQACLSFTFDHLGEANEIEQGRWPVGKPVGQHPSVTAALPRLLALLERFGQAATFFVEGWNALVYPGVLRQIADAGHEIGYHGWRHEKWSTLQPAEERRLVRIGMTELRRLGLPVSGFRTPGGGHTAATVEAMQAFGLTYLSDEGVTPGLRPDGIVQLPYRWRVVDAFYFSDRLGDLRQEHGESAEPVASARFQIGLDDAIQHAVDDGDAISLVFHPFLLRAHDDDRWEVLERALARAVADSRIWTVPNGVLASWIRSAV